MTKDRIALIAAVGAMACFAFAKVAMGDTTPAGASKFAAIPAGVTNNVYGLWMVDGDGRVAICTTNGSGTPACTDRGHVPN